MNYESFAATVRQVSAEDLARPRAWRLCLPKMFRSRTIYRRPALQHGPSSFRWWQPVVVRIVATRAWGVQFRGDWNLWIYTRWNRNYCVGLRGCVALREIA